MPVRLLPQRQIILEMDPLWREDPSAKWCRDNGVARVDGVLRDTRFLPHPRLGGMRGYDIPFRQMIVDPEGMRVSVYRWMQNVGRNGGDRIGPWFFVTYGEPLVPSAVNGTGTCLRSFLC